MPYAASTQVVLTHLQAAEASRALLARRAAEDAAKIEEIVAMTAMLAGHVYDSEQSRFVEDAFVLLSDAMDEDRRVGKGFSLESLQRVHAGLKVVFNARAGVSPKEVILALLQAQVSAEVIRRKMQQTVRQRVRFRAAVRRRSTVGVGWQSRFLARRRSMSTSMALLEGATQLPPHAGVFNARSSR